MRHHAGQDVDRVGLLTLRGETRLSRPPAIEVMLDVLDRQRQLRRAAVDHAADRNAVAFAEGRDPEHVAKGVEGHFRDDPLDSYQSISTVVTRGIRTVKSGPCLNYTSSRGRRRTRRQRPVRYTIRKRARMFRSPVPPSAPARC